MEYQYHQLLKKSSHAVGAAKPALPAAPVYITDNRPHTAVQKKQLAALQPATPQPPNKTGLYHPLKTGIENPGGPAMYDVKVQYHPPRPAQLQAYAQGKAIQMAPGQQKQLPHLANAPAGAVVQRMEDPEGLELKILMDLHNKLYKQYKDLSSITTASKIRKKLQEIVQDAADRNEALQLYRQFVMGTYFKYYSDNYLVKLEELFEQEGQGVVKNTKKAEARKRRELDELRQQEAEGRKKRVVQDQDGTGVTGVPVFSDEERELLAQRLKSEMIHRKLYKASAKGYQKHRQKAMPGIDKRAGLNELHTVPEPMSTSDLAMAQQHYEQSKMGDSLMLEKGKDYQVTMSRGGGQEIQQLGPYLKGGKKQSVEEIIELILKDTGLNSMELGQALQIRDPKQLRNFLKNKNVSSHYFAKIRALRQLVAVEKDRGPEVSLATSLELRSMQYGFSHATKYPEKTPLGPVSATTDIRNARKNQLKKETKSKKNDNEFPQHFNYIPGYIDQRSRSSTSNFLTQYINNPRQEDPEANQFLRTLLNEQEDEDPSDMLIDATSDMLRTPLHYSYLQEDKPEFAEQQPSDFFDSNGFPLPLDTVQEENLPEQQKLLAQNFSVVPNIGNSCYIAGVMVTVLANPLYRSLFLNNPLEEIVLNTTYHVIDTGRQLLRAMDNGVGNPQLVRAFRTALLQAGWLGGDIHRQATQQDAGELLDFLLDLLGNSEHLRREHRWKDDNYKNTYNEHVQSNILNVDRLPDGDNEDTLENLLQLNLHRSETARERLDNNVTRRHNWRLEGELPPVLTIQLSRFNYNIVLNRVIKLHARITSGLNLTIPAALTGNGDVQYRLTSFVLHHGESVAGGHYTSYMRTGDNWFAINDDVRKQVTPDEVLENVKDAYIITYERM